MPRKPPTCSSRVLQRVGMVLKPPRFRAGDVVTRGITDGSQAQRVASRAATATAR